MKTTLELPDDLMREIKVRAAKEDRRLKDIVEDLLRAGLANPMPARPVGHRVKLPILKGGHPARPGEEMTPERMAQVLLDQEVSWASKK